MHIVRECGKMVGIQDCYKKHPAKFINDRYDLSLITYRNENLELSVEGMNVWTFPKCDFFAFS